MIIFGSSRQGRKGGKVADWIKKEIENDHRFHVDYVDLQNHVLPFFDEPISPFSMGSLNDYTQPEGKAWAERVAKNEAVIIITPEYNHSFPGVLKNALDWVGKPWIDKPVGFISYGGISGGTRAIEQLRLVAAELGLIQVAAAIHFPFFKTAFDEQEQPLRMDYYTQAISKMLDEIIRLREAFTK